MLQSWNKKVDELGYFRGEYSENEFSNFYRSAERTPLKEGKYNETKSEKPISKIIRNIKNNDQLIARLTSMGLEVDSVAKFKKDSVIDIDMTPNRADCLSVMGIARDLSPIYKKKVLMPKVAKLSTKTKSYIKGVNKKISTAYSILVLEDFDNSLVTPKNISDRLELCGISQINFIVDILYYFIDPRIRVKGDVASG